MNFLLHRALTLRELGSPAAGIGAMLPDLWRMADRRVRATSAPAAPSALGRGIAHHLEADRWFHATEVFMAGERATCAALVALGVPKLGRFGHISWELCLDGALLLEEGLDKHLAGLRNDLRAIDAAAVDALADHYGAARLDAAARSRFHQRMGRIVEGLAEGSWIGGYRHGTGLAERLEGVRLRVGLGALEPAERAALAKVLEQRLLEACGALPRLLEERRAHREAS